MSAKGRKLCRTALIGLAMGIAVFAARGGFAPADTAALLMALCDGCFVSGALILCAGALVFSADGGTFDMLRYGVTKALKVMQSEEKQKKYPRTYYDYKQKRHAREKAKLSHFFWVGGVLLAMALVFFLLYTLNGGA